MTEEDVFIREICGNPKDISVRLIYADWLLDNDRVEQSRFIKEQITGGELSWNSQRYLDKLHWVQRDHRWLWELEEGTYSWNDANDVVYTRLREVKMFWRSGFVYRIELSSELFEKYVSNIFSKSPIEEVSLTDKIPYKSYRGNFCWSCINTGFLPCQTICKDIWDLLDDYIPVSKEQLRAWKDYYTLEKANNELSQACVTYGRIKVGLQNGPGRILATP